MRKPERAVPRVLLLVLLVALLGAGWLTGAGARAEDGGGNVIGADELEKVTLVYFHPRFRCLSCNNIEQFARETVEESFGDYLESGKLEYRALEIERTRPEILDELGASGSSLYVVAVGGGRRVHSEITRVWIFWNNPEKCKEIISAELESYLAGRGEGAGRLFAGIPVLAAAFLLGLLTSVSPCPLATNIAALSYVSRRAAHRRDTVMASVMYTAGRVTAYTAIGVLLIYIGLSTAGMSRFLQGTGERFLGPLLILFGLVMLDVLKFSIFKGRLTSRLQEKMGERGLPGAFMMGVLFALAFCPYSAVLFFGMLMPMALDSTAGAGLPPVYGLGTGIPVVIIAVALAFGVSELGKHIGRVQKVEKYLRKGAGMVFVGVGIYYTVLLVRSLL